MPKHTFPIGKPRKPAKRLSDMTFLEAAREMDAFKKWNRGRHGEWLGDKFKPCKKCGHRIVDGDRISCYCEEFGKKNTVQVPLSELRKIAISIKDTLHNFPTKKKSIENLESFVRLYGK